MLDLPAASARRRDDFHRIRRRLLLTPSDEIN
jgi:hypothetical protein